MGRVYGADITVAHSFPYPFQFGDYQDYGAGKIRYVRYNHGAGTIRGIRGMACVWVKNATDANNRSNRWEVTADLVSAAADVASSQIGAGIILSTQVVENGQGCWMQEGGEGLVDTWSDGSIADNEYLVVDHAGPTDGHLDTMADGEEEQVIGATLQDDETVEGFVYLSTGATVADFVIGETISFATGGGDATVAEIFAKGGTQYALRFNAGTGTLTGNVTGDTSTAAMNSALIPLSLLAGNYILTLNHG